MNLSEALSTDELSKHTSQPGETQPSEGLSLRTDLAVVSRRLGKMVVLPESSYLVLLCLWMILVPQECCSSKRRRNADMTVDDLLRTIYNMMKPSTTTRPSVGSGWDALVPQVNSIPVDPNGRPLDFSISVTVTPGRGGDAGRGVTSVPTPTEVDIDVIAEVTRTPTKGPPTVGGLTDVKVTVTEDQSKITEVSDVDDALNEVDDDGLGTKVRHIMFISTSNISGI